MSGNRRTPVGLLPGEMKRKAIHLSTFLIPLIYLDHRVTRKEMTLGLALAMLLLVILEVVRLRARVFRIFFHHLLGDQLRRRERRDMLGGTYLVLGFLLSVLAFPPVVAVAACEFLVLGDTAAALVGKSIGRIRAFDKTLEGSLACFLVCAAVGWALSAMHPAQLPLPVALAGAFVATIFEILPVPVDDNLKIPLSAGLVMHFLLP